VNVPLDRYAVYPEYDNSGAAFDAIGYIGECFGETHIDYRVLVNATPIAKSRSTLQLRNRRSLILPYFPAFPLAAVTLAGTDAAGFDSAFFSGTAGAGVAAAR
jgi:hypothetical protein